MIDHTTKNDQIKVEVGNIIMLGLINYNVKDNRSKSVFYFISL